MSSSQHENETTEEPLPLNMENIKTVMKELLDSQLAPVNTKLGKLESKLEKLESKTNDISTDIKELNSKLGNVFEMSFRNQIQKQFGDDFSRPFLVTGLYGISRLLLPKSDIFREAYNNTAELQRARAEKMAEYLVADKVIDSKKNKKIFKKNIL